MFKLVDLFKNPIFRIYLLVIAALKFGFIFLLPNTPSNLAPDEGQYSQILDLVSSGGDLTPFYGLYTSSRSLIIPARLFHFLGFSSLDSLRIVSAIYGLLSIVIFVLILCNFANKKTSPKDFLSNKFLVISVLLFTFLPSHFLWSELALRESVSEFWILAASFLLLKVIANLQVKLDFRLTFLILATVVLAFGGRKQTVMIFLVAVLLSLFFIPLSKNTALLAGTLVISGALGIVFTTAPSIAMQKSFELILVEPTPSSTPTPSKSIPKATKSPTKKPTVSATPSASQSVSATPSASQSVSATPSASQSVSATPSASQSVGPEICKEEGQAVILKNKEFKCHVIGEKPIKVINSEIVLSQIPSTKLSDLQTHYELNREDAKSALPASNCNNSINNVSLALCLAQELPYRISSLMFRPLFPFDQGSTIYNLASFENYIWIILFLLSLFALFYRLIKKQISRNSLLIPIYAFGFIVSAAIYEGNLGTAFRHKSSILWCLIFICYEFMINQNLKEIRFRRGKNG